MNRVLGIIAAHLVAMVMASKADQPRAMVQPVDGQGFVARLVNISQDGTIVLDRDGQQATFSQHEWVAWGAPTELRRAPWILFADESWMACDSISIAGQQVDVQSRALGSYSFETRVLRAVLLIVPSSQLAGDLHAAQGSAVQGESDELVLTNGDRARGTVVGFTGGNVEFTSPYGTLHVDGAQVSAMMFRKEPATDVKTSPPAMLVGLRDGSLLRASQLNGDGSTLAMRLECGIELELKDRDDVAYVQSLRGGIVYLSDLVPLSHQHIPYLAIAWPYQNDRNALGGFLRGGARTYPKGLGMHSEARVVYRLEQPYRRLDAELAVDDHTAGQGSVIFHVSLRRGDAWKPAYTSGVIRGGDAPVPVSVDLAGATELLLHVGFAERGDVQDHANWLNARLVK
jgi:hypothetical protein